MKSSKYNFFFDYDQDDTKVIAYNALKNSLALVDRDKYGAYQNFINSGAVIEDEVFHNELIQYGFILDDAVDELTVLRYQQYRARFQGGNLTLTLAPTSDCNFRCSYCYQQDVIRSQYMTDKIQDAIVALVKDNIEQRKVKFVNICWYGG